ncbi:DUF6150 family protein [Dyella sp. BiH032]|uniref:DUF6150 family protein n=1 Tax=Dyella sp. BiH032 TaxID=3075430 RepID=UPI0028930965|nr:DUF6150 family protein [Dyella sp. BiH032]WNL44447.1 DUF6150 family protein [Dyella sp. BiH032]
MARIYVTDTMGEAQVRVAIIDTRGDADLWVCRVDTRGLASGDERWFFTQDQGEATKRVFFTSRGFAQVKVCFVPTLGEAGWRDPSRARRGLFS